MSTTPTTQGHLTAVTHMMHVLAPGVLSGGYKNQSNSALAHQTGQYMTGGEGFAVICVIIVCAVICCIVAAVLRVAGKI